MNSQKNDPSLTIVVVTFRDIRGVIETLNSVENLKSEAGEEVQVVVVDGGTGPDFHAAVAPFSSWADISSRPDGGIYDAMNEGLRRSRGRYVWFLNGGDKSLLSSWNSLAPWVAEEDPTSMLFADYILDTGRSLISRKARSGKYMFHGLPTSHQAILYPGNQVRQAKYDLKYRIVGDYELTARLVAGGITTKAMAVPLAQFGAGGMSQVRAREIATEARTVQRDVLHVPIPLRLLSRALHSISRWRRALQTA